MANTLLRLGLWTLILVLALYVIFDANQEQPFAEMIPMAVLQQALVVSVVLIIAGIVGRFLSKGAKVVVKNRCATCRTPIASGAIYCRPHLRSILHEEEDKAHKTRERPLPP